MTEQLIERNAELFMGSTDEWRLVGQVGEDLIYDFFCDALGHRADLGIPRIDAMRFSRRALRRFPEMSIDIMLCEVLNLFAMLADVMPRTMSIERNRYSCADIAGSVGLDSFFSDGILMFR